MEDDATTLFEPLIERAEVYGKTSYELFKLKTVEKTSDILSTTVSRGAALIILGFFLLFASLGLSIWLGDLFGKVYYGLYCVAGFYAFVGIILYFFMHKWMKKRTSDSIISQILNE